MNLGIVISRLSLAARRIDERWVVVALAGITMLTGMAFCTMVAGGADAYGYVSQADLWLKGDLRIEQLFVNEVPWPSRRWAFAPLGYRPTQETDVSAIVPTYSPGLPMLMAAAKLIGGQCALFAVVPISGGILVLVTYGLGRRLGSSRAGLIGAWLVATSPAFLFMLMWPMTDVPVAVAWATAFYFLLGSTRRSIVAAGLAVAMAILIRPNLFFGAGLMGMWYAIRGTGASPHWRRRLVDAALFGLGVAPGIIITAAINRYLYGSATTSGYGGFGSQFHATNLVPNLRNYVGWFLESQSAIPAVGLLALLFPIRRLWPGLADRKALWIIAAFVLWLWAQYMAYLVFDAWWYLRFLLSSWPFIMIGVGAVALALTRPRHPVVTTMVTASVIALGLLNVKTAIDRHAFALWREERRYASAGRLVRTLTETGSVILSMQHSGSVRYYAGRMTLRFDQIDDDWLDRAVAWLSERGVPSYLLIEGWEESDFRRHFARQRTVTQLDLPPLLQYEGPAKIALYDLSRPRPREAKVLHVIETFEDTYCVPPAPEPTLELSSR